MVLRLGDPHPRHTRKKVEHEQSIGANTSSVRLIVERGRTTIHRRAMQPRIVQAMQSNPPDPCVTVGRGGRVNCLPQTSREEVKGMQCKQQNSYVMDNIDVKIALVGGLLKQMHASSW